MATSRISAGILAGLTPGLQRGARAFAGGDAAFQQGFEEQTTHQTKMAQALASMRFDNARADELEEQLASRKPQALQRNAMMANGVPLEAEDDVSEFLQRGKLNAKYDALSPDEAGPVLPRPSWESNLQPTARQLAATNTALALGDKNSENVAKAAQIGRSSAISDAIIRGQMDATKVAQAEYAVRGSAPYKSDEWGVTNMLTGDVNNGGGVAQLFAQNRQAEIRQKDASAGASRASAANSYAAAGQHRAATDKIRQDVRSGDIVVQPGPNGEIWLVNKLNGLSRRATDAEGAAIMGRGSAGKEIPTSVTGKILDGRQGVANIDAAIQAVNSTPNAMGITNAIPGAQTIKQLWASPDEIGARAQVANIGSLVLHDRSGAAVTVSEFPRLAPFIPSSADTPAAATAKLKEMKRIAEDELGLYLESYSPENGYRSSTVNRPPAAGGNPGKVRRFNPATGRIE